ncbi:SPI-1 type III secretion system effector SipA [Chromobacterium violaceum]|uniref:SPI-1 type III secretion system effector SipA n=1 Tax=Chromobacterium violaceum TaxID=536 RepID=UPI00385C1E57
MPITGASHAAMRPLSAPPDGTAGPASPLGRKLRDVRADSVEPARRHSLADLASYQADYARRSVATLFAASPHADKLGELYQASPNRYAKLEIAEFAKVYSQLKRQPDLDPAAGKTLDDLAQQYAARILKDGLGVKSAFGPWTQRTDKHYQLRSGLERKLAEIASRHCQGDAQKLGNDFMRAEVTTFILSCVETHLGRQLDEATSRQITGLVDSAAMQAFEDLRQRRGDLIEQRGFSVGTLARDLDTVAVLPQLLRSLLEALPPGPGQRAPEEPARDGPARPTPSPDPGPAGPGEAQRPQEIHYHIDNSIHWNDNSQDNRRWNRRGDTYLGGARQGDRHLRPSGFPASGLAASLRTAASQDLPKPQQAVLSGPASPAAGRHPLLNAADQVGQSLSGLVDAAIGTAGAGTRPLPPGGAAESSAVGLAGLGSDGLSALPPRDDPGASLHGAARAVADSLSAVLTAADGAKTAKIATPARLDAAASGEDAQQPAAGEAIPADAGQPGAGGFDGIRFRDGNLYMLPTQAYLRGLASPRRAENELLRAVRGALEPAAAQPMAQRREFEALRNRILPGDRFDQDKVLDRFASGGEDRLADDAARLRQALAGHPGLERHRQALRSFARTLIREANLLPSAKPANPLVAGLLDALGIQADEEARRAPLPSKPSGVVLTTDGLHVDSSRAGGRRGAS